LISRPFIDDIDHVVDSLTSALLNADSVLLLAESMSRLKSFEQRKYLSAVIAFVVKQYFPSDIARPNDASIPASKTVSGAADLLYLFTKDEEGLKDHLVSILTRSTIPSLDDSLAARRSVMAALAQDEGKERTISIAPPY
jgi:telomere length regulation protein